MAMKHYRFADISFTLDARYPWLEEQCREYETEPGAKSIRIAVTEEEIDRENVFKEAYSRGYLESLADTGRFQKQSWITMLFCFTVRQ